MTTTASQTSSALAGRPFWKMHGLGNDFVVLDGREHPIALSDESAAAIADRKTGVGCDQLILLEAPRTPGTDVYMRIRNNDGGEVEACGNATRCVADLLARETGRSNIVIETVAGLLNADAFAPGAATVDMGPARLDWQDLPLAREMDTLSLPLSAGPLANPVGVSMGNPHAVFFVPDAEAVDLASLGPGLEHDPLFPKRANIEAVTVLADGSLRQRTWERGVGITRACGTGACAVLVAAVRRGLIQGRKAVVRLDGGDLTIEWRESDGHVLMSGAASTSFTGTLSADLFRAAGLDETGARVAA
ncbi:diaminopimelate epimerase [Radicibacter daui]|uniref:diaminopimelate epimerase n=1 Tax=Radicibacter daui TaxID=3064829 RepID=UPI004046C8DF